MPVSARLEAHLAVSMPGWKKSVGCDSRPRLVLITALIPVVPATTTYLSCSGGPYLGNASCCSLIVLLKVALLLGWSTQLRRQNRLPRGAVGTSRG